MKSTITKCYLLIVFNCISAVYLTSQCVSGSVCESSSESCVVSCYGQGCDENCTFFESDCGPSLVPIFFAEITTNGDQWNPPNSVGVPQPIDINTIIQTLNADFLLADIEFFPVLNTLDYIESPSLDNFDINTGYNTAQSVLINNYGLSSVNALNDKITVLFVDDLSGTNRGLAYFPPLKPLVIIKNNRWNKRQK